jgi:diguanylate cyclase (GGDEF)-like protein
MRSEQNRLVYIEQVRLSYRQTSTAVVGGSIGCAMFVWVFWDVSDTSALISWWIVSQATFFARIAPWVGYKRRPNDDRIERWGRLYVLLTVLQGSIWGAAWWILLPTSDPLYNLVAALWIVGLSGSAVSAYTAHLPSMLAFLVPVVAPGIIKLFTLSDQIYVGLGLAISIYAGVLIRAAIPVNRAMVRSIGLNFELEREIKQRKEIEDQLRELSITDALTGLSNRRHFDDVLDAELQRAQRKGHSLSLVLIDIDDFKSFNDTHGHVKGDECLQRLSTLIEETVRRPGDLAARYGGDELALIFPDTDAADALRITDGICKAIYDLNLSHESSSVSGCDRITTSAGIASIAPKRDSVPADFVLAADKALYKAKREGRNRAVA